MRSPRTVTKSSPCSPQLEKARMQQRRPNAAKNKKINLFKKKKEEVRGSVFRSAGSRVPGTVSGPQQANLLLLLTFWG